MARLSPVCEQGGELAEDGAPAVVEAHLLMLAAVLGAAVEDARRIEGAAVPRLEGQDRGQREPRVDRLPTGAQRGGEDEAPLRHHVEEAAVDVRLEIAAPFAPLRFEPAAGAQVERDDPAS